MAKYEVGNVFVGRGKVYPLIGQEVEMTLEELFDRPDLLTEWKNDEFGRQMRGLCRKADVKFLEMKLGIAKQVISEGGIKVNGVFELWDKFDTSKMSLAVLQEIRAEIERRVRAKL